MGTPFTVSLVLLALLLGAAFALDDGDSGGAGPEAERSAPIATIERRVERIRDLRFRTLPRPQEVSPAQAKREGLEDFDRSYPPARRRADEEVLKLLGLLEPDVDLRGVSSSIFGQAVAGYYDPRTGRLRIVEGAQTANRVLNEITLAHELTHALEDQRLEFDLEKVTGSDDRALAYLGLVEGTASAVMFTYAERHFSAEQTLGGLLSSLGQDTGDLPPFIEAQLIFPYVRGQQFIERLHRAGGWKVVDAAFRFRPPASTEQILHPGKYLRVEQPERVDSDAGAVLGAGWRRLRAGTWGEWATGQLLANPEPAEGWGGDRYELWQRGEGDCEAPCRDRDALVMRWRWDTPRDAREFETALREWAGTDDFTGSRTPGPVAIGSRGREVALALAPAMDLAERLVE
jgi:hypothetical protein